MLRNIFYTSSGIFTVPPGVTSLIVEAWGGGGGGGDGSANGGGGGGGGAYSKSTIAVTPGNSHTITVGSGGAKANVNAGAGGDGGDSSFGSLVLAKGGIGGLGSTGSNISGSLGGSASSGIGDVKYSGGNGGGTNTSNDSGGGGGGAAGDGGNGSNGDIASAGAGFGEGGWGGVGGLNGLAGGGGNYPGGGGGGGEGTATAWMAGHGGDGLVKISYTDDTIFSDTSTSLSKDAYIDAYTSFQNTNFGGGTLLNVYNYFNWQVQRTLVNFTLPTIPGTILDVRLFLYGTINRPENDTNLYFNAHSLNASWDEMTVTWANAPAYNTQVIGRAPMQSRPGWFRFPLMGSEAINPLSLSSGSEVNLLIKVDVENTSFRGQNQFASKEYTVDLSKRPYVEVVYQGEAGGVRKVNFGAPFAGL